MGSEQGWNKADDGMSLQRSEPALCVNGCGFFGSAATMNLCSKCYRDAQIREEQAASAKAAFERSLNPKSPRPVSPTPLHLEAAPTPSEEAAAAEATSSSSSDASGEPPRRPAPNRCGCCNKRVGLTGFSCRCGATYCSAHRYPEAHDCSFDFKGAGRSAIAKANPVVKADKVQRI